MDLQARKYEFIRELFKVDKASVMDKLEKILRKEQFSEKDNKNERETLEQYNAEIDESIAQIERGEFYTQEEVEKMASKW